MAPGDRTAALPWRRIELLLFVGLWIAYASFHQGGGWNPNTRFAMVRSLAEAGELSTDRFLAYTQNDPSRRVDQLERVPIRNGRIRIESVEVALGWTDPEGGLVPLVAPPQGQRVFPLAAVAASGDLAFYEGRLHPNKAPGTSLLGVPVYVGLLAVERTLGLDPDDWWVLTVNAWVVSAGTVALLSALGAWVFLRFARRLYPESPFAAFATTLAFALGTLYFPYATMFYEHNLVATCLLAATYLVVTEDSSHANPRRRFAAGSIVGLGCLASYLAAVAAPVLAAWWLARLRSLSAAMRASLPFAAGVAVPLLALGAYHTLAFGNPFATNYQFEAPQFVEADGALLGVLQWPRLDRLAALLVSPFRGVFVGSPFLLMSFAGGLWLWRNGHRETVAAFGAYVGFFLLFNSSFNGWHAGWSAGPRYLIPTLPFLALCAGYGFVRFPRATLGLASLAFLGMGAHTAVDPQPPVGVHRMAKIPGRSLVLHSPLFDYALPVLFTGEATPLLDAQQDALLERERATRGAVDRIPVGPEKLRPRLAAMRERGSPPFEIGLHRGPVSANPVGVYEAGAGRIFGPRSPQARWNSFNLGEFLFPGSLLSLAVPAALAAVPLGVAGGLLRRGSHR